jgi:prefoldin subunit 5
MELAEETWVAASRLVSAPDDANARLEIDRLAAAYAEVYATAATLAADEKKAAILAERIELQERLDKKNQRIEKLRNKLREAGGTE